MKVTVCDVGPRDGLQNQPVTLAPEVRAELVGRIAATGGKFVGLVVQKYGGSSVA